MFSELVKKARSTRRFVENERIDAETLEKLVDIARIVPSGANGQPLRYRIVSTPQECEKIYPCLAWAGALKDWDGPEEGERPSGFIIMLSDAAKNSPETDIGISAQTIQLAATEMGFAACMLGAIKRDKIHEELGLPENLAVRLAMALGKPGEEIVIEDVNDNGDTKYYRTEDNIHHVPKRRLNDIIIG